MRRKFSFQSEEEEGVDMTPMLDIVFIMLIFFIVTASFVKEAGIDVNRPGAVTAEKKEKASIWWLSLIKVRSGSINAQSMFGQYAQISSDCALRTPKGASLSKRTKSLKMVFWSK